MYLVTCVLAVDSYQSEHLQSDQATVHLLKFGYFARHSPTKTDQTVYIFPRKTS